MKLLGGLVAISVGLVVAVFVTPATLSAQEDGVLAGLIVGEADGRPVAGATVSLPSLGLSAATTETGFFTLEGLPTGNVTVRFDAPDYVSVTENIDLSGAEFIQVRLLALGAALDEIVVLVGRPSGAQHRNEVAVRPDEPPATTVLDLLTGVVPGVSVQRGGGIVGGGGAAVRIRGIGTFRGTTAPEVYLDGVRLDGRDSGEHAMHILDQIPASEVARIRVHKGASASPYAFSANGVIVIETRRGGGPGA